MTVRVGINGFGRIGRTIFRAAMRAKKISRSHINDLTDTKTIAHFNMTVHGTADFDVKATDNGIMVDGKEITISAVKTQLNFLKETCRCCLRGTGLSKREDADLHIKAGAPKVLISAPAKGEDINRIRC